MTSWCLTIATVGLPNELFLVFILFYFYIQENIFSMWKEKRLKKQKYKDTGSNRQLLKNIKQNVFWLGLLILAQD